MTTFCVVVVNDASTAANDDNDYFIDAIDGIQGDKNDEYSIANYDQLGLLNYYQLLINDDDDNDDYVNDDDGRNDDNDNDDDVLSS